MKPFTLPSGQPGLPPGWRWVRTRFLCDVETGTSDTVDAVDDGDYPFFVRSDEIEHSNGFTYDAEAVMTSGDGAGVGKIFHHYNGRFLAHQRVYVMSRFRGCLPRFFYYYLSSEFGRQVLAGTAKSTVESLRRSMLTDFVVAVPLSRGEQETIVAFLDSETTQIDSMIAAQQELIARLDERRAAVILEETVSRCMRESPARLSRMLLKLDRPVTEDAGVVTAYRDGEVTLRSNRRDDGYTFSETEGGYQGVAPGDVVFHALDGFAGAVGVSDSAGNCSPVYHVCRATAGNDPVFLSHLLRALGLSGFLTAHAWSVRQRSVDYRNWSLFGALPVRVPTLDDQRRAVAEISDSLAKIDTMIAAASEAIMLIQERRAALISAAVTGRIDPRTGRETTAEKVLEFA